MPMIDSAIALIAALSAAWVLLTAHDAQFRLWALSIISWVVHHRLK
jgi:hypothetical protein